MPNFKWFRLAIVSIIMIISTIVLVFLGHFIGSTPSSNEPSLIAPEISIEPERSIDSPIAYTPVDPDAVQRFDYKLVTDAYAGYQAAKQRAAQLTRLGLDSYIWEIDQPDAELYVIQLGAYPTRSDCDSQALRLKQASVSARCWHPSDGFDSFTTTKSSVTSPAYYKVILGVFPNYAAAQAASASLSTYIWEKDGLYVAQVGAYSTTDQSRATVEKLSKRGIVSYIWQESDGFYAIRNRNATTPPHKQNYHVVMGVFKTEALAKQKAASLDTTTTYTIWANALGDTTVYRIVLGSYTHKSEAKEKQRQLDAQGIQSFVIFQ